MQSRWLHKKVWIAWNSWLAIQYVGQLELSFGFRIEPYRPLLDLFIGPVTIAIGYHPVLTDPRMNQYHGGRGFVCADEVSQQRDLGTIYDVRVL
jgi:hypothetical protein